MENEVHEPVRKKRPGYLTAYANHARIKKTAAAKQLQRVGIDYMQAFEFAEADRLRAAARHADREKFAKPIYVEPGADPLDDRTSGVSAAENPAFAQSQARKELFRAKLVELEYEERIGSLVLKSASEAEAFRLGRLVRDAILNVPSRLAGILAAEMDQRTVHDLLDRELRQALEVLAELEAGDTPPMGTAA